MRIAILFLLIFVSSCANNNSHIVSLKDFNQNKANECKFELLDNIMKSTAYVNTKKRGDSFFLKEMISFKGKFNQTNLLFIASKYGKIAPLAYCPEKILKAKKGDLYLSTCIDKKTNSQKSFKHKIKCSNDLSNLALEYYKSLKCSSRVGDYLFVYEQIKILSNDKFIGGCLNQRTKDFNKKFEGEKIDCSKEVELCRKYNIKS